MPDIRVDWSKALEPIYLQRVDKARRMARFYAIRVERTLFGDWSVIYLWGRIGCRGQYKEHWLTTRAEACEVRDRQLTRKILRGYVMLANH